MRLLNINEIDFLDRWLETPSMQYFTGEDWFHWDLPITPNEIIECEKHFSSEVKSFIDEAIKNICKI